MRLGIVASFPGHSCLQFFIACSMHKKEGEGLGDRAMCVTSGRRCPIVVTHKICDESSKQQTVLTLSFEHYCLKFLYEILQEQPPDSL